MVYPKCRTHSCPPNEKHPPDSRTGDPKLLSAKCRITPKFPNEDAPIDDRNRAPKAHTRNYPTSPMRTRPLNTGEGLQYTGIPLEVSDHGHPPSGIRQKGILLLVPVKPQ